MGIISKTLKVLVLGFIFSVPCYSVPHSVTLSWTLSTSDQGLPNGGYKIFRTFGSCSANLINPVFTQINSGFVTVNTYKDSTVSVGEYCYFVTFYDPSLNSESIPSNAVDVKVIPAAPTNPAVVTH